MKSIAYLNAFLLFVSSILTPAFADEGRTVTYQVDGSPYEGYFATPGPQAPLVLLVHDWDGLTDYEIRRAKMLAGEGYAVFALDLFGAGVRPTTVEDKRQLTGELYKDRGKMRRLMRAALETAAGLGADVRNAVAAGYCFGGAAVLELARSGVDLKGFVSFHGGLKTPDGQDWSAAKAPILVLHGTADTSVPMEAFADLAKALEAAGVPHEMITYSGAPHAFTVFGTDRYRQDADEKSWARFLDFLAVHLK